MTEPLADARPPWASASLLMYLAAACLSLCLPAGLPAQVFQKQVVVAQERYASDAGALVLRQGGSAVDAAVATAFALAVTHPAAGNIGGGGFLVAFIQETGQTLTFDFRETAPAAATEGMYLDPQGRLLPRHRAGPRAAGVPGTVRGLALAHSRLGRLPWKELLEPAVRLASEGFQLSAPLARSLNSQLQPQPQPSSRDSADARLADFPATVAAYAKPDGSPWQEGDNLALPDLAATLKLIQDNGPDGFYTGPTAQKIADYMVQNQGLITLSDLAAYQARERPALLYNYRDYQVHGMGPPSSGGIVTALILNQLEPLRLREKGRIDPQTLHLVTEAMRRAFFIRATQLADPDFHLVPVDQLISKDFAASLAQNITTNAATPSASLADFPIPDSYDEKPDTTHFSVLDAQGNAVALTYTLEQEFGSKAVVPGAGFLLNNEMGDFNLTPGITDRQGRIGTTPNLIVPRKRMLSSQSPTIVTKNGKVFLVTGSPGGRTIPNTVSWILLNVLEFGLPGREALDAPRSHHAWFPDTLTLEQNWPLQLLPALKKLGHQTTTTAIQGDAHSLLVDPETRQILGLPDRRRITGHASGD